MEGNTPQNPINSDAVSHQITRRLVSVTLGNTKLRNLDPCPRGTSRVFVETMGNIGQVNNGACKPAEHMTIPLVAHRVRHAKGTVQICVLLPMPSLTSLPLAPDFPLCVVLMGMKLPLTPAFHPVGAGDRNVFFLRPGTEGHQVHGLSPAPDVLRGL